VCDAYPSFVRIALVMLMMIRNDGARDIMDEYRSSHTQAMTDRYRERDGSLQERLPLLNQQFGLRAPSIADARRDHATYTWLDEQVYRPQELSDQRQRERNARLISGPGMLTAFFNLMLINTAKPLMREDYGVPSVSQESMMTSASLAGAMLGQIVLGSLSDVVGRKKASLLSASLTALGAAAMALAQPYNQDQRSIYTSVAIARLLLGIGVGGDYPILASITAENAPAKDSASALIRNSIMIGLGAILAQAAYATLIPITQPEVAWRSVASLGAFLSLSMVAMRQTLLNDPHTESPLKSVQKPSVADILAQAEAGIVIGVDDDRSCQVNAERSLNRAQQNESLSAAPAIRPLWRPLAATAACWMLYDIVDFSLSMYSSEILGSPKEPEDGALMTMGLNFATLTGALTSYKLISTDRLARNSLQKFGFAGLAVCHLLLAAGAGHFWQDAVEEGGEQHVTFERATGRMAFLGLYVLQQLFDSAGPAIGIYVIPAEIFPTATRGTCMGIASSAGKLGAVLGSAAMPFIRKSGGLPLVFMATGMLSALGAVITQQGVPNYGSNTLEKIEPTFRREGASGLLKLLYSDAKPSSTPNEAANRLPV
jgi:PHS family inorganic phosphate transporter-like MFS transporter